MAINLDKKDIEYITQYPGLAIDRVNKIAFGDIYVNRSYNEIVLSGTFSIKIELEIGKNSFIPKVYETSTRLDDIAQKLNMDKIDIHVNKDKSLCMVISDKEHECFENTFTMEEFFDNCIEPYFYWVMYYEKFNKPPWEEYAHGELGFFEMYAENDLSYEELVKKFNVFKLHSYLLVNVGCKCLCGSKNDMELCHPLIHKGLYNMQRVRFFRELNMNIKRNIRLQPLTSPNVYAKIS